MTAIEILNLFLKGNEATGISEKQKNWLIGQAKKDGVKSREDFGTTLYFDGFYITIKNSRRLASGGSYVGTKIVQGRYNLRKSYHIKFTSTGLTACYDRSDLDHFDREKIEYEILDCKELYNQTKTTI